MSDLPKTISVNQLPILSPDDIKDTDYLLATTVNDNNVTVFARISPNSIKDYLKTDFMMKLGLQSTYSPYLFQVYFSEYDYAYGINRLESYRDIGSVMDNLPLVLSSAYPNGCTGLHIGSLCGHNYDVPFDEYASFVVRTPLVSELQGDEIHITRHATLSISSRIRRLTKNFVNSRTYDENYNLIPFYVVDGINDSGLCISVNSLPSGEDAGFSGAINYHTVGTNPEVGTDLCALMLSRVLLDKCATIDECLSELNNWNVWCPYIEPFSSEFSWDITDATGRTIHLEIIDNQFKVIEGQLNNTNGILSTNFYQYKWNRNTSNILIRDGVEVNNTLTPHSRGLERYSLVNTHLMYLGRVVSIEEMLEYLQIANYLRTYGYSEPTKWLSEYCANWGSSYGDLTIHSNPNDFNSIYDYGISQYNLQKSSLVRLGKIMHTNHSVVYDVDEKLMQISMGKSNDLMEFKL